MSGFLSFLVFGAIELAGVTGDELYARAFFEVNNVRVGDPLVLTVDFVGRADFQDLHPPALARRVDRRDWKVYDESAKTDTFRDARRLTYRVRPMRPGVLWFPALEFSYVDTAGGRRTVRSNAIPVHAKARRDVALAEMSEADDGGLPAPAALVIEPPAGLGDDARFAWRRAVAHPSADAFRPFDFPEARLNEARQAILEGQWARALAIYRRLEWRIGQTPEIERGIVAALARKHDNAAAVLPVWRQVGRPVLRYDWRGRVGIVAGVLALVAFVGWLIGRGIRAVACLAVILLTVPAGAQDIFQQMNEMHRQMQRQMQQMTSGFSFSFGGGAAEEMPEPVFRASVALDAKHPLRVGDAFSFIVSLEVPRGVQAENIRLAPTESFALRFTGACENLPGGIVPGSSNTIIRIRVPARYDAPFRGKVGFALTVPYSRQIQSNRRGFAFSSFFSREARVAAAPVAVDVRPLDEKSRPADFAGLVSEGLRFHEYPNLLTVETNDVVTITYRLLPQRGYVPRGFLPPGAAFEAQRETDEASDLRKVEYVAYFVADGAPTTPKVSIPYYDPRTRTFGRVTVGGTPLKYKPEQQDEDH